MRELRESAVELLFNLREVVRPTKITAMALRAKLWVYAASPLFNGGWNYSKVADCKLPDGTPIFPTQKDPNKWVKAKQHLEELLQACDEAGLGLRVCSTKVIWLM